MPRRLGVVASGHPAVSEAAAEVLRAGGNAFDAAIAAGFASAVAEPAFTSLGGGGFLLGVTPDGKARLFDFFPDTPGRGAEGAEPHFEPVTISFPGADQVFHVGLGSAAVPANLKGFATVVEKLGRLSLDDVVAPAIRLSREGVEVTPLMCHVMRLLWPILTLTARGKELFAPGGHELSPGDVWRMPDTGEFLATLASGGLESFYEGELARTLEQELAHGGGVLTREDLAAYQVIEREPLAVRYRDHTVLVNPPPSGGGEMLARFLMLLESATPDGLRGLTLGDTTHARLLAATMREGERMRAVPLADEAAYTSAAQHVRSFSRGTTHVSVADAQGNVASMTTSNGEGSGYIVPGTGIMLNNMMGEDDLHPDGWHTDPPGVRISSMMSPTIVLDAHGAPHLALGSGGSKRIRTALLQVLVSTLDLGASLTEAVEAPRVHWDGEAMQVEPGLPADTLASLREDVAVNEWDVFDVYFGGVHAVNANDGGAGDPRRGGHAMIVTE
jgi:gamma-glutamyltranspeptidase/glutathione hydrolase